MIVSSRSTACISRNVYIKKKIKIPNLIDVFFFRFSRSIYAQLGMEFLSNHTLQVLDFNRLQIKRKFTICYSQNVFFFGMYYYVTRLSRHLLKRFGDCF